MFTRLYCTLTEHWWTQTLAPTLTSQGKTWQLLEAKVRTMSWQTKCNPALHGFLWVHSVLCISKEKLIFRFEADSVCQTQSVNWQSWQEFLFLPPSFTCSMGIPSSAFSRLCAALRTPMASFSSSSCGWLRGWLQQVLVKQSARGLGQSIFDTDKDLGKKNLKKPQHQNPREKGQLFNNITASFLFCREGSQKEDISTSYFPLYILHWDLPLPSMTLQADVWYTRTGILIPNTST